MPRLSENTLEKRFRCDFCGGTFRTRQGLSGHIQFKHNAYYEPEDMSKQSAKVIDMKFLLSNQRNFLKWRITNGLSKSTSDNIAVLFVNWGKVISLFDALGIDLTDDDFKTYILSGLDRILS